MKGFKQCKPMKTIRKGYKKRRMARSNAPGFIVRPPGMNLQTYDVTGAVTASTTTSLTLLHVPNRTNSNYNNRYGDSTTIKTIRFKYFIKPGINMTVFTPVTVRVLLFWDEQPNGVVPTGSLPLLALDPNSNSEPQYAYRFKLLRDERHVIYGGTSQEKPTDVDWFLGNLSLVTNFNANNEVIGDINTGALYVYIIGDVAAGAGTNPTVTFSSRTRFAS